MAGAGYKQFADGDVLTAAQVQTFLQDQAVMRFADSSARDTALGTAVAEGMLAYLDDTDEVLFYDGSAWGALGLPLGTATPTDGQFLSFGTATSTWNPVNAPGGLVAVKHVLKTNAFTSGSVSAGGSAQITGTSITHEVADAANKVILIAHIGAAQGSNYAGQAGFAFHDGSSLLGRGVAAASRTRVVAGGWTSANASFQRVVNTLAGTIVHTPGTGSKTYSLYVMNLTGGSATMYVNQTGGGTDANNPSASTSLTLLEVSV